MYEGYSFPHILPTLVLPVFFIINILVDVRWHLIMVLIFISLMTNDVEHVVMCLLAIFGKMSIQTLCWFFLL